MLVKYEGISSDEIELDPEEHAAPPWHDLLPETSWFSRCAATTGRAATCTSCAWRVLNLVWCLCLCRLAARSSRASPCCPVAHDAVHTPGCTPGITSVLKALRLPVWRRLFFHWMTPLIVLGKKRQINLDDLPGLSAGRLHGQNLQVTPPLACACPAASCYRCRPGILSLPAARLSVPHRPLCFLRADCTAGGAVQEAPCQQPNRAAV